MAIKPAQVFKTEWFSVDAVPAGGGDPRPYYRVRCQDGVQVVAMTPDREIVMVKQFRPAIGAHVLEMPSGYVDKGETPKQAAAREFKEETGFTCELVFMGFFHPAPSRIANKVGVFFGRNAKPAGRKKTEREIKVALVPEKRFDRMILDGKLPCVSSLAFYHLAKIKGLI